MLYQQIAQVNDIRAQEVGTHRPGLIAKAYYGTVAVSFNQSFSPTGAGAAREPQHELR